MATRANGTESFDDGMDVDIPDVDENQPSLEEEILSNLDNDEEDVDANDSIDDDEVQEQDENDDGNEDESDEELESDSIDGEEDGVNNAKNLFNEDGSISLKEGDTLKVTPTILEEIKKGVLRMQDYTRKTTQVANDSREVESIRAQANEVLTIRDAILRNPQELRKHLNVSQIVSAFTQQEMLNIGLKAAGVPSNIWNAFHEWASEEGNIDMRSIPKEDPYAPKFIEVQRELGEVKSILAQRERQEMEARQQAIAQRQKNAYDNEYNKFHSEIDSTVKEMCKGDDSEKKHFRTALLTALSLEPDDSTKTIQQMAKAIVKQDEARYQAWLNRKRKIKTKLPQKVSGHSVSSKRAMPQTFEEVEQRFDEMKVGGYR